MNQDEDLTFLIAAYLEGGLDSAERDRFEARLASSGDLRMRVALAREALEADEQAVPGELLQRSLAAATPTPSWRRWAAVAALVAVSGLTYAVWTMRQTVEPAGSGDAVVRGDSGTFESLSPPANARVDAASLTFHWNAIDGAEQYVVTLWRPDGSLRQESITTDLELSVSSLDEPLPAGPLLWKVRAESVGRVLAESTPRSLVVEE